MNNLFALGTVGKYGFLIQQYRPLKISNDKNIELCKMCCP